MKDPPQRRTSPRLQTWDYRFPGWYFVTICSHSMNHFFGSISSSGILLSQVGEIAKTYWLEIPSHFENVEIDEFVVLPNHVHGILILQSDNVHDHSVANGSNESPTLPLPKSLSSLIRSYKSVVTRWARANGYSTFAWQPRFYDHIIRDEEDLRRIRKYIRENPLKWELDEYFISEE